MKRKEELNFSLGTNNQPKQAIACSDRERLKAYAKGELLDAMTGKLGGVDAEVAAAPEGLQGGVWIDVEARCVGDVEDLPSEVERGALPDMPRFVESGVDAEDAIAAEGVAGSGLARDGVADRAAGVRSRCNRPADCQRL